MRSRVLLLIFEKYEILVSQLYKHFSAFLYFKIIKFQPHISVEKPAGPESSKIAIKNDFF